MKPTAKKNRQSRGYSLIELLATIAIASAVVSFVTGELSPIRANALTTGGNHVVELLANARQNSISRNSYTAMVISKRVDAFYNSCCLFELSHRDDGSFSDWKQLTPWKSLPDGVRFDPNLAENNFLAASGAVPADLPDSSRLHSLPIDLENETILQVYQPDGTLAGSQLMRLRLVEGYDEPPGSGISYSRPNEVGEPANTYDIIILRDTGQLKVERL